MLRPPLPRNPLPERHGANSGREDPRRESVPPLTPAESENLWRLLKEISDKQDEQARELGTERGKDLLWRDEIGERIQRHADRLTALERATQEAIDARLEFKAANQKLDKLLESDAKQWQDILSLQQRREATQIADASAKEEAGKVEKKLNTRTVLVLVMTAAFTALFEAAKNALSARP